MTGTIIITGCASGLGLHAVRNILARSDAGSYQYIFTIRSGNSSSTKTLQDEVTKFNNEHAATTTTTTTTTTTQSHAEIQPIDLGDLKSVRAFASKVTNRISTSELAPIRALVLNAGIGLRAQNGPEPTSSTCDIEKHFHVNYLANLVLSLLLLRSIDKHTGRIVYVSSWTHDSAFYINASHKPEPILWKDDDCELVSLVSKWPVEKKDEVVSGGGRRYGASKFWLVMGMLALQKRIEADATLKNISVVGLDPGGNLQTGIARHNVAIDKFVIYILGWYVVLFARFVWPNGLWRTEAKTAQDMVDAALLAKPAGQDPHGLYLNGAEVGEIAPEARQEEKQDKLWIASLRLANLKQDETVLKL